MLQPIFMLFSMTSNHNSDSYKFTNSCTSRTEQHNIDVTSNNNNVSYGFGELDLGFTDTSAP